MILKNKYKHYVRRSLIISFRLLMLHFILAVQLMQAQTSPSVEYQVKAVFLYNFTRFIDWPETAFKDAEAPFVIGIYGNDPFGNFLEETVMGEKTGTHNIVVKRFSDAEEAVNCHILYINSNDAQLVKKILKASADHSVLTVSESTNFLRWGGQVKFFTEENKIRLQINTEAAKNVHLTISSKLLSVAQIF